MMPGADREMCACTLQTFDQTGDGHFSPIGAYNEERDLVLILDVVRVIQQACWYQPMVCQQFGP